MSTLLSVLFLSTGFTARAQLFWDINGRTTGASGGTQARGIEHEQQDGWDFSAWRSVVKNKPWPGTNARKSTTSNTASAKSSGRPEATYYAWAGRTITMKANGHRLHHRARATT
ncbi:MAG: hypothetical protein U1F98_09585 [Verrucomicrobiota bacterium]